MLYFNKSVDHNQLTFYKIIVLITTQLEDMCFLLQQKTLVFAETIKITAYITSQSPKYLNSKINLSNDIMFRKIAMKYYVLEIVWLLKKVLCGGRWRY